MTNNVSRGILQTIPAHAFCGDATVTAAASATVDAVATGLKRSLSERVAELERNSAANKARIAELERNSAANKARIAELERNSAAQDVRIAELERNSAAQDARITANAARIDECRAEIAQLEALLVSTKGVSFLGKPT